MKIIDTPEDVRKEADLTPAEMNLVGAFRSMRPGYAELFLDLALSSASHQKAELDGARKKTALRLVAGGRTEQGARE